VRIVKGGWESSSSRAHFVIPFRKAARRLEQGVGVGGCRGWTDQSVPRVSELRSFWGGK
jgi:hypothetical protein